VKALRLIGYALLGLIAGFVLTAVLGLLLVPEGAINDGGREMAVFFGLAPLGALIGAVAGTVLGVMRGRDPTN
jgi:hypothetical protein